MCWSKLFGGKQRVEEEVTEEEGNFLPEPKKFDYPVSSLNWTAIRKELQALGLGEMTDDMPDKDFFFTDEEGWERIFPELTYPAEYFADFERRDCDDYSKKASADSSFYYGLNCLQVWGNTPYGFHAFSMVRLSSGDWKLFEPNASFECAGELLGLKNKYGWEPIKWKP